MSGRLREKKLSARAQCVDKSAIAGGGSLPMGQCLLIGQFYIYSPLTEE
jgi:hypothetical protein